jgi:hypothetical protein
LSLEEEGDGGLGAEVKKIHYYATFAKASNVNSYLFYDLLSGI